MGRIMNRQCFYILLVLSLINFGCTSTDQYTRTNFCDKTTITHKGTRFDPTLPDSVAKLAILAINPSGQHDAGYVFSVNGVDYKANELGYCEVETNSENCILINSWDYLNKIYLLHEFIRVKNKGMKVDTFSIRLKKKHITYFVLCHYPEPKFD